jgi:hypothetical protein
MMPLFITSDGVNNFGEKLSERRINVLDNAVKALQMLLDNGVEEHLEIEYSCSIVEDCLEHLKSVQNYQPNTSKSPAEFERNGGYGLSAAERNK